MNVRTTQYRWLGVELTPIECNRLRALAARFKKQAAAADLWDRAAFENAAGALMLRARDLEQASRRDFDPLIMLAVALACGGLAVYLVFVG